MLMRKRVLGLAMAAVLVASGSASAFWFITDMFDMIHKKPQEGTPLQLPPGSLSQNGWFPPARGISIANSPTELEPLVASNPITATPESIATGKALYEVHCIVCHGPTGLGDGPVATKAPALRPWFPLGSPVTQGRSDAYLYAHIWAGGAVMGPYWQSLEPHEPWHLINYIRTMGQQ